MVDGKLLPNQDVIQNEDDVEGAEARMRKALGGMGASSARPNRSSPGTTDASHGAAAWQGRQSRRFVRDGEVRVETLQVSPRPGNTVEGEAARRVREAGVALQTERAAREKAERALEHALEARRQLEMRLWHETNARTAAEAALQSAATQREAVAELREALASTQARLNASQSMGKAAQQRVRSLEAERQKLRAAGIATQRLGDLLQSALIAVTRALTRHDRPLTQDGAASATTDRQDAPGRRPRHTRRLP